MNGIFNQPFPILNHRYAGKC